MAARTRVKLFGDPRWVLGYIARETCARVNAASERVHLSAEAAPASVAELREAERDCDVLHYLNPWEFVGMGWACSRPRVVTYHHVVEGSWSIFDDHYRQADAICAITPLWRAAIDARREDRSAGIFLTLSGVDGDRFRPDPDARRLLRRRLGLPEDAIVLGFSASKSSNFGNRKGPDRYFSLMRALRPSLGPRLRMAMFGEGWTPEDVPEDVREGVAIPGYLPYDDLPSLYAGLDYYLCLSTCEGGPYPLLESMACGVKVISTPVGCVPGLLRDGENGFCVGHDDFLERIPPIIARWTDDRDDGPGLRDRARKSVLERHAWGDVIDVNLYESIYEESIRHWRARGAAARLRPVLSRGLRGLSARAGDLAKAPIRLVRTRRRPGRGEAGR